jgi:isoquinoline 1-oxidoreductase subunit alpha
MEKIETYNLTINGQEHSVRARSDMPLLWALRDLAGLTGTKFGCGIASCGACTVVIDGVSLRSCVTPISSVGTRAVTTIEGAADTQIGKAVQEAWLKLDVVQCGYCQSGQIMSAIALLQTKKSVTDEDIDAHMSGNICRCGTYPRIRAAIHSLSKELSAKA